MLIYVIHILRHLRLLFSPFIILDPWYTGNFEWLWVAPCDVCPGRSLPWDGCRSSASLASLSSMYPGLRLVWWRERKGTVWAGFFGVKSIQNSKPMLDEEGMIATHKLYILLNTRRWYTMVSLHVSLYYAFGSIISNIYDTNLKHVRCDELLYAWLIDDNDMPFWIHMSRYTRSKPHQTLAGSLHVAANPSWAV